MAPVRWTQALAVGLIVAAPWPILALWPEPAPVMRTALCSRVAAPMGTHLDDPRFVPCAFLERMLPGDAVTRPDPGRLLRDVAAGESVRRGWLTEPMPVAKPNTRSFSLVLAANDASIDSLRAGDFVDVLTVMHLDGGVALQMVAQKVQVLEAAPLPDARAEVTFSALPEDVERLTLAAKDARVVLTIRNSEDLDVLETGPAFTAAALTDFERRDLVFQKRFAICSMPRGPAPEKAAPEPPHRATRDAGSVSVTGDSTLCAGAPLPAGAWTDDARLRPCWPPRGWRDRDAVHPGDAPRRLAQPLAAGDTLRSGVLTELPAPIPPRARSAQLFLPASQALHVRVGDEVDVLFASKSDAGVKSVTLLQKVSVLELAPLPAGKVQLSLAVLPEEAQLLALAPALGHLSVSLRQADDAQVLERMEPLTPDDVFSLLHRSPHALIRGVDPIDGGR